MVQLTFLPKMSVIYHWKGLFATFFVLSEKGKCKIAKTRQSTAAPAEIESRVQSTAALAEIESQVQSTAALAEIESPVQSIVVGRVG